MWCICLKMESGKSTDECRNLYAIRKEGNMGQIPLIKEMPKECPFCHDIPIVAKDPLWNEGHGYYGNYEYYVACKNGKCKIHPRTKSYNDIYDMSENECIESAIKDWNSR